METSKEILTELQEIAPALSRVMISRGPYLVPRQYFSDFSEILMMRIRFEADGFSENTNLEISSKIEIAELSPLLSEIQRTNTYQVPDGFFETLALKIPELGKESNKNVAVSGINAEKKPVIFMPVRWIRYVAAACIVGLIGVVTFNMTNRHTITDPIRGLASVSNQDMANYLDADDVHWTSGLSQTIEPPSTQTASTEFNQNDIRDLMSSVPDDELEQYSSSLPEQKRNVN